MRTLSSITIPAVGVTVCGCGWARGRAIRLNASMNPREPRGTRLRQGFGEATPSEPRTLNTIDFGSPFNPELRRRSHVSNERRRCDDGRTREVPFAADAHAVLPVAIERRDRALARIERVLALAEARSAP